MESDAAELVRAYYRGYDEWGRLVRDPYHRLELETTLHFLTKYLPAHGSVLDVGGGPGRYTVELARRGYRLTLVDFTPEHLERARRNVARAGVADRVDRIAEGSVVDLSEFREGSFDAVLCLGGPLNHVLRGRDRVTAVRELARVARPNAPIVVSVISRYAAIKDGVIRHPDGLRTDPRHYARILRTGDYDGHRGFAPCHFFTPEELEGLFRDQRLRVEVAVGLEGLVATHDRAINPLARRDPKAWANWKRLHRETCTDPAVVATSEHFLMVTRRPPRRSRARTDAPR